MMADVGEPVTNHPILQVRGLTSGYGSVTAVRDVSLTVGYGEAVGILGRNGAGKTTLLTSISGLIRPSKGEVIYEGDVHVEHREPHDIVKVGICQVLQGRHLFPPLRVIDNLMLGAYARERTASPAELKQDLEEVYTTFPRLAERKTQLAGTLSGGEQQMLAIGRALMGRPKLLLLDEPSLGIAPLLAASIFETLAALHKKGISMLLVEQNAELAFGLVQRCYVMENGHLVLEGRSEELMSSQVLIDAYLGLPVRKDGAQ